VLNSLKAILPDQDYTVEGNTRAKSYQVCRNVTMPSILIEMGFITGNKDAVDFASEQWRQDFAQGIADGILAFYEAYGS
jgi:N-acetylmuramoyl-L-alanine amidase